jgi:hypothetical protein
MAPSRVAGIVRRSALAKKGQLGRQLARWLSPAGWRGHRRRQGGWHRRVRRSCERSRPAAPAFVRPPHGTAAAAARVAKVEHAALRVSVQHVVLVGLVARVYGAYGAGLHAAGKLVAPERVRLARRLAVVGAHERRRKTGRDFERPWEGACCVMPWPGALHPRRFARGTRPAHNTHLHTSRAPANSRNRRLQRARESTSELPSFPPLCHPARRAAAHPTRRISPPPLDPPQTRRSRRAPRESAEKRARRVEATLNRAASLHTPQRAVQPRF